MAPRTIDAPKGNWLTNRAAAREIGLHEDTFLKLVKDYPWIRPRKMRGAVRWFWLDIFCLSHIIHSSPENSEKNLPPQEAAGSRSEPKAADGKRRANEGH